MYKVLSKLLANRLKKVIHKVISENQFAFLEGRQIGDNILIVNELVDEAKSLKREALLFKVDFEKAYNSVDWNFLKNMMVGMGFNSRWRKWINACVRSAAVSILVNGSLTEEFLLGRGLRQGDPLSPFLFLLVAEGFSILMDKCVKRKLFDGYEFGNGEVQVSHTQ